VLVGLFTDPRNPSDGTALLGNGPLDAIGRSMSLGVFDTQEILEHSLLHMSYPFFLPLKRSSEHKSK
jgi:hypothetical protein